MITLGFSFFGGEGGEVVDNEAELLTLLNSSGGQSSYHNYADATDVPPWTSEDQTTNNNDHTQSTGSRKPLPATPPSNGADFDSNATAIQTINEGTFTVTLSMSLNGLATVGNIISSAGAGVNVSYDSSSTASLDITARVAGQTVVTRQDLYNALNGAGEVVVELEGLVLTNGTDIRIGRTTNSIQGTVRKVAMLDETALGVDLAQARTYAALAVSS